MFDRRIADVYREYEQRLKAASAMDFDDLLLLVVHLLRQAPDVLASYRERFRHVLVDEFQDTNRAQNELALLLAAEHRNVCVVGDSDQSIFGWRGADIRNIIEFEEAFPDSKVVVLEQNYRSTQVVLDAANAVIANNLTRRPKELWTEGVGGEQIVRYRAEDEYDEAAWVTTEIGRLREFDGVDVGDVAVFYRTNAQSRALEEELVRAGIPYKVVGGTRFYDRREVKDVLAYLRLLRNPADEVSARRVVNVPRRGVGDASVDKLARWARAEGRPFAEALDHAAEAGLTGKAARGAAELGALLSELRRMIDSGASPGTLVDTVTDRTGYRAALEAEDTLDAHTRLENIGELASAAAEYEGLDDFLESVALVADTDELDATDRRVSLMTLHTAKGLEFPAVFLVGLEDGVFPHLRALEDPPQLEEERRLCYVGITRARERLYLTHALESARCGGRHQSRHPEPLPVRASRRARTRRGVVVERPVPDSLRLRRRAHYPAAGALRSARAAPWEGGETARTASATPLTTTMPKWPTPTPGETTSTTPTRGGTRPSPRPRRRRGARPRPPPGPRRCAGGPAGAPAACPKWPSGARSRPAERSPSRPLYRPRRAAVSTPTEPPPVPGGAWDAATYDRVAAPQTRWGAGVLDRVTLEGDETVLDAGCGSGRVTEMLLHRLPAGRAVALDGDPAMLEEARRRLAPFGARVRFVERDLLALVPADLGGLHPVDAVLSTATFHWVLDHDRLFANLAQVMRPGAPLVAQCGAHGNIARLIDAVRAVGHERAGTWLYATVDDTRRRLIEAGFTDVEVWTHPEPTPLAPGEELETYLETVCLRVHVAALPERERIPFIRAVARAMPEPVIDYVRLNIDARRARRLTPAGAATTPPAAGASPRRTPRRAPWATTPPTPPVPGRASRRRPRRQRWWRTGRAGVPPSCGWPPTRGGR